MSEALGQLHRDGYCLVAGAVSRQHIAAVIRDIERSEFARLSRKSAVYGGRNLLGVNSVRSLAAIAVLHDFIHATLGPRAQLVRGIFFDKTEEANWSVPWHQDLTLAVSSRHEIPDWTNWTRKAGVVHVQPPASILERMLTLRIHLDDCDASNGPLHVIAGTHVRGRLGREDIVGLSERANPQICRADAGTALLMRPLLLHASPKATKPGHRRVVHLEFASENLLPSSLQWATEANQQQETG